MLPARVVVVRELSSWIQQRKVGNAYNSELLKPANCAKMAEVANGEGPSTSSRNGIICDGDNVVMDANGYKSLVTIKKGRYVSCLSRPPSTPHSILLFSETVFLCIARFYTGGRRCLM